MVDWIFVEGYSLLIVHLHGEGGARLTLQFREELS
jgi:hypothetical protein